jgi:hypothetical protein
MLYLCFNMPESTHNKKDPQNTVFLYNLLHICINNFYHYILITTPLYRNRTIKTDVTLLGVFLLKLQTQINLIGYLYTFKKHFLRMYGYTHAHTILLCYRQIKIIPIRFLLCATQYFVSYVMSRPYLNLCVSRVKFHSKYIVVIFVSSLTLCHTSSFFTRSV